MTTDTTLPSREEISQLEKRMDAQHSDMKDFKDEFRGDMRILTSDIKELTKNMSQVVSSISTLVTENKLNREYQADKISSLEEKLDHLESRHAASAQDASLAREGIKNLSEDNTKNLTLFSSRLKALEDKNKTLEEAKVWKARALFGAFLSMTLGLFFLVLEKFSK